MWPTVRLAQQRAFQNDFDLFQLKNFFEEQNEINGLKDKFFNPYINTNQFPQLPINNWIGVAGTKNYIPLVEDVGRMLMLECAIFKINENQTETSQMIRKGTSPVLPSPSFIPSRDLIVLQKNVKDSKVFKVVSYNMLAPTYATKQIFK